MTEKEASAGRTNEPTAYRSAKPQGGEAKKKRAKTDNQLFIMALAGAVFLFVFSYLPMTGILLAFRDADNVIDVFDAIFHSAWAGRHGFENFYYLLTDDRLYPVLMNTVVYNLIRIAITMPIPMILAILFNEVRAPKLKKTMHLFSCLPHFVSSVVYVGIVFSMTNMQTGVINDLLKVMGVIEKSINFKGDPSYSWAMKIVSAILKESGWGTIIYMAAMTNVDTGLYDAAEIDGANRFWKARAVSLPAMLPLFSLNLVLAVSGILTNDAGEALLWQTQSNLTKTEMFDTFILKNGINEMLYSYATAAGLFKSLVGTALIVGTNFVSKKINGEGVVF